jgi:hypothetical protein
MGHGHPPWVLAARALEVSRALRALVGTHLTGRWPDRVSPRKRATGSGAGFASVRAPGLRRTSPAIASTLIGGGPQRHPVAVDAIAGDGKVCIDWFCFASPRGAIGAPRTRPRVRCLRSAHGDDLRVVSTVGGDGTAPGPPSRSRSGTPDPPPAAVIPGFSTRNVFRSWRVLVGRPHAVLGERPTHPSRHVRTAGSGL